jgi:hypothetical protein
MNVPVPVFDNSFLSKASGFVERCNSHAVPVSAPSVRIDATLVNSVGNGDQLVLQLEGSYDGQVWQTTALSSAAIDFGANPSVPVNRQSTALIAVDYAFVRLRATLSQSVGTDARALFSAELVFSHQ